MDPMVITSVITRKHPLLRVQALSAWRIDFSRKLHPLFRRLENGNGVKKLALCLVVLWAVLLPIIPVLSLKNPFYSSKEQMHEEDPSQPRDVIVRPSPSPKEPNCRPVNQQIEIPCMKQRNVKRPYPCRQTKLTQHCKTIQLPTEDTCYR